ncbi:MAG: DegV family protein [Lachnospiraceae bacterium]|nr:DegV family protein [Lachnospiraceae bacterium]
MKKIAVITDSNSGITQAQAKALGLFVLPMPFMIDGETYFEDINLKQNEFYEKLKSGADISTSQPSPEAVMKLWDEVLNDYEEIVHIPMSSGLSGSCQSALMLSGEDEYDGKVFVVNNQRISVTQRQSCIDAMNLIKAGYSGSQIKNILEKDKFNSSIYIMLDTLFYLKKGGRITPAAAALGTLLKLKPVLTIQGEKLDAFSKARTVSAGKAAMLSAITNDIETRFGGVLNKNYSLQIAYTYDTEAAKKFAGEVKETFPDIDIHMDPLSLSVACHIGPGALAVACTQHLKIG